MLDKDIIKIALPKGRLLEKISQYFKKADIEIIEESRKLYYVDKNINFGFLFVKNSDVPVYVHYGVACLGIVGTDIIYEYNYNFLKLLTLPFGETKICLAGYEKDKELYTKAFKMGNFINEIKIATKYPKFTKSYFIEKNIPVKIIELSGSIELAPILGLSNFIVDLVETGTTLKENNLSIIEELGKTEVRIIANPGLYKINYNKIDNFIEKIKNIK